MERFVKGDVQKGDLPISSAARPNRLFAAEKSLIKKRVGVLNKEKVKQIQNKLIELFEV